MFQSQLEAVDRATPRERIGRGKTSPMTICGYAISGEYLQARHFVSSYPCARSPCGGEEENEDGDEGNLSIDSGNVVGDGVAGSVAVRFVEADSNANDGDEKLANHHCTSAIDEERATTEFLHGVEGDGSRADIDECKDQGDQECVADGTGGLQEGS